MAPQVSPKSKAGKACAVSLPHIRKSERAQTKVAESNQETGQRKTLLTLEVLLVLVLIWLPVLGRCDNDKRRLFRSKVAWLSLSDEEIEEMARDVRASCKMERSVLEARSLRCLGTEGHFWLLDMARDYYALLDIPRSATTRQIRSGYQWAAAKWHPQKNPGAKVEAQSRFRDIAEAYDVLIDPLRRQQFDAHGEVGLKNPPHDADFEPYQYVGDPFELFNQFFSSADPLSVAYEPELEDLPVLPSMPKESTIEMEIECTLSELKEGSTRCVVVERTRLGPGFIPYQEKKPVTLPIRPGWQAGMRIIFKGAGNHSHKDNQPGDLAVRISQKISQDLPTEHESRKLISVGNYVPRNGCAKLSFCRELWASLLSEDLDSYSGQYGTHGAIQRLQFIATQTQKVNLKIEALKLCLDLMKRTTNCKGYTEVHNGLKELLEGNESALPPYDQVWVEATQKQNGILKDLYEQDLNQAKASQMKENIRQCYHQLTNLCLEQGDFPTAEKYLARSREFCTEPQAVFATCMTIIRLRALQRQYSDIQNFTSKAHHTPFKDEASQSRIFASYGLYNMTTGKYKDAATSFSQVKPQDLGSSFSDILSPQDVALYGVLCGLGSLDRAEVQSKLLDSPTFRECLDMAPQLRDLAIDFCSCRYAACLASLDRLKEPLSLDVHLSGQVANLCEQIRSKGIVQYFAPFLSVSLHRMAEAFNTDVESMQREVAKLIGQRQLDAKIDSQRKILHASHADQRRSTYNNALRVSNDFLDGRVNFADFVNLLK
ncbi:csn1 [Symbiodinium sp. KB8]|nr:csn1 [Symbiodinium sp. KB8]